MNSLREHSLLIPLATALFLSGCSEPIGAPASSSADVNPKKEEAVAVEPVTAKTALRHMHASAREWTKDYVILTVKPKDLAAFKNEGGKAARWEVTFASPSLRECRVFTYAIAAQPPDIYKGVVVGRAMPWGGETRDVMITPISGVVIDSDAAYALAVVDAKDFLKKFPGKKVEEMLLGNAYRFQAPVWYFRFGDKKVGYVVMVDANTGKLKKKLLS